MRIILSCAGLAGLLLLSNHRADAAPAWCAKAKDTGDLLDRALEDEDPDRGIPAIVEKLCFPDADDKAKLPALEARRRLWMKRLAMTEGDWASDVVEWASVPYSTRNTAMVRPTDGVAWSAAGPVEQFALLMMQNGASDHFALQAGAKHYMADAFKLGQAARLGYVAKCMQTSFDNEVKPVEWATCQPDVEALDATKFAAELRGDAQRTAYDRMIVRIAWANTTAKLPAHAAKVKTLVAKDPAYAKMFELARAAHTEWAAANREGLLALVGALDDARVTRSRRAVAGCSDKVWPLFVAAIGKLPAASFAHVQEGQDSPVIDQIAGPLLKDADAYLAANALVACEHGQDVASKALAQPLATWPGFRGPRTATITKIWLAALTLDDAKARFDMPGFRLALGVGSDWKNPGGGHARSVVAKVERQGDTVKLSFQKSSEIQTPCMQWRTTNRISMIDITGKVRYEQECVRRETQRVDTTPAPVTIATRYATGIAPGTYVVASGGVVAATWKSAKDARPSAVLGVAVK